jgi:intergrase/recombinase
MKWKKKNGKLLKYSPPKVKNIKKQIKMKKKNNKFAKAWRKLIKIYV